MVNRAPRDLNEWMRSIERGMAEAKRALNTVPLSYYEKVGQDSLADRTRTPTAPVEITYQTALYTDTVLAKQYARLMVDFPDVTKATDGSTIPIAGYELWGRDDTSNYLDASTDAAPGLAAPGLTFPGLASTSEMEAAAAQSISPWRLLATSTASQLRVDRLVPGSVWTFKVRALGTYTIAPGVFSSEYQAQLIADSTPPPQPTAPVLKVARGTITVNWDGMSVLGAMPSDFHHLIVAWGDTSSPTAEKDRFFRGNGVTVISDAEYYKTMFVRFQAVDESGNISAWSEQSSAFTVPLVDTDVILAEIDGAKTVLRNITGAALVDGAILSSKLADNAITQEKLADNIISLGKLENTVTNSINKGIADAATAQAAAVAADSKAGTAQAAADAAQTIVNAIVASGSNLAVNGNFDLPILSPPTGWPFRSLMFVEASAGVARSGTNVMRATPSATQAYAYTDYVDSATGRTYYIEYYVRLREALGASNGTLKLGAYATPMNSAGVAQATAYYGTATEEVLLSQLSTTTWTRFATKVTISYADTIKARFGPRIPGLVTIGNNFEIDDFKVVDMTEAKAALDAAAAAQALAQSAFDDAQDALEQAGLAQDSADGAASVYYLPTAPSGTLFKPNSIWFRSPDNKIFVWDGDSWEPRADTAIATAQAAANAASSAASTADAKAVAAQNAADAAQDAADDAAAAAVVADDKADAAQVTASNAGTAAATADTKAVNAQTAANNAASAASAAQTSANNAASAASTADSKAVNAQTAADNAASAASAAQTSANNAASAASTADGKAVTAQTAANNAQTAANNAQTSANNASTLANSIVKTSTSPATGTPPSVGALWNQTNADGSLIIATWTSNSAGTQWVLRKLDDAVIGNLNAATINAGIINAARYNATDIRAKFIEAGKITAADMVTGTITAASGIIGSMSASVITTGTLDAARLNAGDVRAAIIAAGKITAADMVTGTITSASGIIGSLSASVITTGTLDAARLNAGDVRAAIIAAGKITAADMVTGTITAASGIIGSLDAAVISTGTLNAARIAAGSIAASKLIIGSAANAVPDPMFSSTEITNARLALATGGVAGWTVATPAAGGLRTLSRVTTTGADQVPFWTQSPTTGLAANAMVKFTSGQKWLLSVDVETSASAGVRWNIYRHRADGSAVYESLSPYNTASGRRTLSYVYTVPDGTVAGDFALLCNTAGVTFTVYGGAVVALQASATLIEDSGITTPKIATDAVRANHIKAGEIVASHLVTGTLTSASGVFGDISAASISSGTLDAARLNAGDIRAKFLAAGLVTAADMVAGTITAASGIIGSLDIGKVTTGQLDGIYIKSNTIEAQHLRVTDLTNFAPSYAESPNDWVLDAGISNSVTGVAAAWDKRRFSTSGTSDGVARLARGPLKMVKPGEELYAEGVIYRVGPTTNAINLRYYFYDTAKLYVSSISKTLDGVTNTPQNSANGFRQQIMAVVPDGVMYARLALVVVNSTGDDVGMYNIMGRRRNNADLIVDGSISATKVDAASVAGAVGSFITLNVSQLNATTSSMSQAVIDKLWTDVVNSRKITAEMMVVTGENLLSNSYGQFGNNTDWSDWTFDGTDKPADGRVTGSFYVPGSIRTTKYLANNQPAMPVNGDSWYVFEGWIKATAAGSVTYIEFMEDNGVNPSPQYALSNYAVPTVWTPFSVKVKTSPGQKAMQLRMFVNHANGGIVSGQKIAGMRFRPAVGSDLVVNGSILASHLGVDSVTASAIKALEIQTGHLASNSISTDKLATGSVTAAKLEATLVLATKILAGPATDTHAEMNTTGFKVFAKDALGNLNETVRLGVAATNDYLAVTNAAQELVTTISDDGTVSARKVVTDQLTYKGQDMQVLLDKASLGMVAWGQFNGNQLPATIANATERGLFEIAWEPVGTRMYAVSCSPVLFTPTSGTATAACFRMRYTTDGTQPTTTSPILAEDFKPILVNGAWTMSFQFADRLIGGFNGSYIRILFSIACSNGAGLNTEMGQSPTFVVKDLGPAYPKAGVLSNQVGGGGGGSRPPVVTRTKYYTAVDRRSFIESTGAFYNYDTGRMYQGPSPAGVGNLCSMAFFNDMTADLSGATINDMQVYLYFDHWYNNSGGTAKIGLHGHTGAVPSTFNWVGWIMDSEAWPKPGGRWVKIPSAYWAGFISGTYRGITLGKNTTGNIHYGIAQGSPQIYVQYTV